MSSRCPFIVHELARVLRVQPAETCPSSPRDLAESIVDALVSRETCTVRVGPLPPPARGIGGQHR